MFSRGNPSGTPISLSNSSTAGRLIAAAAKYLGPGEAIIEKDLWVTYFLDYLFFALTPGIKMNSSWMIGNKKSCEDRGSFGTMLFLRCVTGKPWRLFSASIGAGMLLVEGGLIRVHRFVGLLHHRLDRVGAFFAKGVADGGA